PQPEPISHAPPAGPTNHPGGPVRRTLGPGPRKTPHPDQPGPFGHGLPGHGRPKRMGPPERGLHHLPDRDIDRCGDRRRHRPRPEPAPVGPDTPGLSFGRGHDHYPGPCVVDPRRSTGPGLLRPGGSTAVVAVTPALYLQPGNRLAVLTGMAHHLTVQPQREMGRYLRLRPLLVRKDPPPLVGDPVPRQLRHHLHELSS